MKKIIFIASALFAFAEINAQVGINTVTPDENAVLDIKHSSKGVLLPQVTQSVRTAKNSSTPEGSLVYDNQKKEFFFKDKTSGEWVSLNVWRAEEGTSNNVRLVSSEAGRNVAIGYTNAADAKAKLDVNGKIRANDSLIGKTIKLDGAKAANLRRDANDLRISADGKIVLEKDLQANGSITASGNITVSANNSFIGYGTIPVGGIIMWSGSISSIPGGWALCDGANGTPNLKGRFVVGYDGSKTDYNTTGKTGGAETVTLNTNQIPSHSHKIGEGWYNNASNNSSAGKLVSYQKYSSMGNNKHEENMFSWAEGGGQAHENRPPYYVLAYIMRTK
ncbi:MAG: hypothetical protein LBG17_09155 [Bacteroidales bacterium]|jgi:microcystin-dependent protein|nr:hypothetical protein [Bacteroidales bacterium]